MSVTQTQINALCLEGKIVLAAWCLDESLDFPANGPYQTLNELATWLCSIDRDILRYILWPLLEPELRDGPFTVYCGDFESLCSAAGSAASVSRTLIMEGIPPVYESLESWLGRSLGPLVGASS